MFSILAVVGKHHTPVINSYNRFWTGEVAAVRRMRAHVGSQSSETHIPVYYVIYK
jgi:hypothetical protein